MHSLGVTDPKKLGTLGILTHPANASLRAETLVVNKSLFPPFSAYPPYIDAIAESNIVFVVPTANVSRYGQNECDLEDMPDRDLWHPDHSFHSCKGEYGGTYRGAMQAIATGKALFATSADLQQDGSVQPHRRVIMCGDTKDYCFAIPYAGGSVTSTSRVQRFSACTTSSASHRAGRGGTPRR